MHMHGKVSGLSPRNINVQRIECTTAENPEFSSQSRSIIRGCHDGSKCLNANPERQSVTQFAIVSRSVGGLYYYYNPELWTVSL